MNMCGHKILCWNAVSFTLDLILERLSRSSGQILAPNGTRIRERRSRGPGPRPRAARSDSATRVCRELRMCLCGVANEIRNRIDILSQ